VGQCTVPVRSQRWGWARVGGEIRVDDVALRQAAAGAAVADVGFKQAMQQKWLALEKGEVPRVVRKVETAEDKVQAQLQALARGEQVCQLTR
jgi:hypothetical protein